jgi:hypothetical protein
MIGIGYLLDGCWRPVLISSESLSYLSFRFSMYRLYNPIQKYFGHFTAIRGQNRTANLYSGVWSLSDSGQEFFPLLVIVCY